MRKLLCRFADSAPPLWVLAVGLLVLIFLFAILMPPLAWGGWGGGACAPMGPVGPAAFPAPFLPVAHPPFVAPAGPVWEWRWHDADHAEAALFCDGCQVGGYRTADRVYRSFDGVSWGPPSLPPIDPPPTTRGAGKPKQPKAPVRCCTCCDDCECGCDCQCSAGSEKCCNGCSCLAPEKKRKPLNFGLDTSKIHGTHHRLNGREVSRDEALRAIRSGTLPDDAKKTRGTVIGPDAARKQVMDDLAGNPQLAEFKDAILWQEYDPTQWAVKDSGFRCDGNPTIYLQAPGGKVLHRQDGYNGPGPLARALRRADPNYDPKKDPDLRQDPDPPTGPALDLSAIRPCCVALAVSLALLALSGCEKSA